MPVADMDLTGLGEVLRGEGVVLVDFWGPMCAPCRVLKPHVARLADEHAGQIRVVAVNTEKETEAAERFGVTGLPTFILFRGGTELRRLAGSVLPSQLAGLVAGANI